MTAQSIRPSQFITTYGPGAIIEGRNGPRLIPLPDKGLFSDTTISVEDYEISNSRLSNGILEGARVFRLPSNAELGKGENVPIYRTKIFPTWNLCVNSNHHRNGGKEGVYILYGSSQPKCPVCKDSVPINQQAVRYIVACPDGHLDDFDWYYFVHKKSMDSGGKKCENENWFKWIGGGSSASNIFLTCPKCGERSMSIEQAYQWKWKCHGRFPEKEDLKEHSAWEKCDSKAILMLRQASNLRVPNILSLFTIPPRDTALHRMLDNNVLMSHILTGEFSSMEQFENRLKSLEEKGFIKRDTLDAILSCGWDEISQAIADLEKPQASKYRELINEELNELLKASRDGAPPMYRPKPSTAVLFEVNKNNVKEFTDTKGNRLRATPISKLSEIAVQLSYRREIARGGGSDADEKPAKSVGVSFTDRKGQKWYPGVEWHGEGIFISTHSGSFPELKGERAREWWHAYSSTSRNYDASLFRDDYHRVENHPLFVYLHTLSHAIIRSLSVDSGYSSSALRERVYLNTDGKELLGGILIYATQPGSEGTSGGLISLVNSFQHIYDSAINSLRSCSNDPLCIEEKFYPDGTRVNGSSCYGCTLISETSCEHRNIWLDRGLVLESLL